MPTSTAHQTAQFGFETAGGARPPTIGMLSTYPPTQCGLATFSAALVQHLRAAGRPVVSTAFPHAIELLADGTGLVVPQRDPSALEAALRRVLSEPGLAEGMAERAVWKSPELLWPAVDDRYRKIAMRLVTAGMAEAS